MPTSFGFLCYSRRNMEAKTRLCDEFKRVEDAHRLRAIIWSDKAIEQGENWEEVIRQNLREAAVGVILVSDDLLKSDFVNRVERPELLKLADPSRHALFPVQVAHFDTALFHKLWTRIQCEPEMPLLELAKDRFEVYCKKLRLGLEAAAERVESAVLIQRSELLDPGRRRDAAVKMAVSYPKWRNLVMQEVSQTFVDLSRDKQPELARAWYHALMEAFMEQQAEEDLAATGKKLPGLRPAPRRRWQSLPRIPVIEPNHLNILALMKAGLPHHPAHLEIPTSVTGKAFVEIPDYAALLLGIRLTEKNLDDARAVFEELRLESPVFAECALMTYALGQCYRKLGDLDSGRVFLEEAEDAIARWGPKCQKCPCGPGCSTAILCAEIARGLGVIARKEHRWDDAADAYERANRHLKKVAEPEIRADVCYGTGYFWFERAFWPVLKKGQTTLRRPNRQFLIRARTLFSEAHKLQPRKAHHLSRLEIVLMCFRKRDSSEFIKAYELARASTGGSDAPLTQIMCAYAIAALALAAKKPIRRFLPKVVSAEVLRLFKEQYLAAGPRYCHAFDVDVIHYILKPQANDDLEKVRDLLKAAATWQIETLAEQRRALQQFLSTENKGKRPTKAASLSSSQTKS